MVFDRSMRAIRPRLDALRPVEPDRPVIEASLEGRQVFLARRDSRVARNDGLPYDYTVPLTRSRLRRESDLERGYVPSFEVSALSGTPTQDLRLGIALAAGIVTGAWLILRIRRRGASS